MLVTSNRKNQAMLFIPLLTLKLWAAQVQDGLTTTQQQQLLKLNIEKGVRVKLSVSVNRKCALLQLQPRRPTFPAAKYPSGLLFVQHHFGKSAETSISKMLTTDIYKKI